MASLQHIANAVLETLKIGRLFVYGMPLCYGELARPHPDSDLEEFTDYKPIWASAKNHNNQEKVSCPYIDWSLACL